MIPLTHHLTVMPPMTVTMAIAADAPEAHPEDRPGARYSGEASGGPAEGTRR